MDLALSTDEFWRLTPRQFVALRERADLPNRMAWRRTATLIHHLYQLWTQKGDWPIEMFDPYAAAEKRSEPDVIGMVAVAKAVTLRLGGTVKR